MTVHSGARQWRHDCECAPDVAAERTHQEWERMHSQVSEANAEYFVSEERLEGELDAEDLREMVRETEGTMLACNVCGRIKEVDSS
jgi:hypothetical protein